MKIWILTQDTSEDVWGYTIERLYVAKSSVGHQYLCSFRTVYHQYALFVTCESIIETRRPLIQRGTG